jgi:hypothetical protein
MFVLELLLLGKTTPDEANYEAILKARPIDCEPTPMRAVS